LDAKEIKARLSIEKLIKKCGKAKVLVVDDKEENIQIMGAILKRLNWVKIFVGSGGKDAFETTMKYHPDLIILDLNMTEMDGMETLKLLKNHGALDFSTVIFVTADHEHKNRLEGLTLGCADYIHKPFDEEEFLIKVSYHLKMRLYEKVILKNLKETNILLNNIKQSVFFFNENGVIIPPISKYTENLFGENIVGKKVHDYLFFNLRKGTKEFSDLNTVFSIIFNSNELQFYGLEDNLPKLVTLPDKKNKRGKTLKLSYSGFFDQDNLLDKIMCTVVDVTDSEEDLRKAEQDQENYKYIFEIMGIKDKEKLSKRIIGLINNLMLVLEDFVSPLSDTYKLEYFHQTLKKVIIDIIENIDDLKSLKKQIKNFLSDLHKFEFIKGDGQQINPQIEATSTLSDILDTLLRYLSCIQNFVTINLDFKLSSNTIVLEKVKDIQKIFTNLFEYVFLVREIHNIDKEKLKKVVHLAKLYPDFDRTIDLIQQRSRFLSFLFKGIGEEKISNTYNALSNQVRKMPVRSRLTEFIIKNNLIEPYKEVLNETINIENKLIGKNTNIKNKITKN